jgi:hypothetical protein
MSKRSQAKPATTPTAVETLNGSNTLPALIEIGEGKTIHLGEIVMRSHATSGLSVEAWNALPETERDDLLSATISELQADPDMASCLAVQVLIVSAPGGPRRRAGVSFGPVPIELREEDLGDDPQAVVEALRADPLLKIDDRFEVRPADED